MEEQELRCPWCGGPLEKGQLWGDSYGFVTEGVKVATHNIFKRVTEKEKCIWFRNWVDTPRPMPAAPAGRLFCPIESGFGKGA
ncbi:MAG TPA: hypothetical protein IAB79_02140 [Candidatus Faecousia excrementipullorum]|nr:hypothetical protein [Candidatus Faecousia excrementipullorum]